MAMGKAIAGPLLILLFCIYMIILGIAGWALNRLLDGGAPYGTNGATYTFVLLSLIAGVVGIASVLAGLHHLKAWRGESGAGAASAALIAWLLTLLAFGLACKEIHSSLRGTRLKVLEAFVIMAAFFQLLYVLMLHAGLFSNKYGPGYADRHAYGGHGPGYADRHAYGGHGPGVGHKMPAASAV